MSENNYKEMQDFFNANGYVVIKNFIDAKMAGLLYRYAINKVVRTDFLIDHAKEDYRPKWDGEFGDEQIPIAYNCYGDPMMDTLLELSLGSMQAFTGLELSCNYSYWRFYQFENELKRHKDRDSCEISTTLCLGFNVDNVDKTTYSDYAWPMWIQDKTGLEVPVSLNPGDMIVYRGCDLDHWREPYMGLNHAQVFMHYNDLAGPFRNKFDGRPVLAIPKIYQV
jgi:hypothetical protein